MIHDVIQAYTELAQNDEHHRYRSWEHCSNYFFQHQNDLDDPSVFDTACIHLAFYLASWGMMRGSSFLLQKDYWIHKYFVESVVKDKEFKKYFSCHDDILIGDDYFQGIESLIDRTEKSYTANISVVNGKKTTVNVTDTLSSKILLGVFGCVPAYDRYFKEGLRLEGIRNAFDRRSLEQLREFYNANKAEFEKTRKAFKDHGLTYTPMKLVDMYFWQLGYMNSTDEESLLNVSEYNHSESIHLEQFSENTEVFQNLNPGLTESIRVHIISKLQSAKENGFSYLDVRAGDVAKEMKISNRIVAVVNAMRSLQGFDYEVMSEPASGYSTTVIYKYLL